MVSAIIVAAGKGIRMNTPMRKQYIPLADRPILTHTLMLFDACDAVQNIRLVIPQEDFEFCQNTILSQFNPKKSILLVPGGTVRQESVYNGLLSVKNESIVLIHDGVRPFVRPDEILSCIREAEISGACIVGTPAFDTIKQVSDSRNIVGTLPRSDLWLAQTPQVFQYALIKEAHERARRDQYIGTDDASLVERLGKPVKIIPGSRYNIKITTQEDLFMAETILRSGLKI